MRVIIGNKSDNTYNRMLWASRRGMLELDLWLIPLQKVWHGLSATQRKQVFTLLAASDDVLWDYFTQSRHVLDVLQEIDVF